MGYYTSYKLEVTLPPQPDAADIIDALRSSSEGAAYSLNSDGSANDSCKWYEHEKDLAEFSKKYPGVLFTLRGEGEEQGDIWALYVKNGKSKKLKAQIMIPSFDEGSLS